MKRLNKTCILILAAGEASRMQKIKQLLTIGSSNLLEHAIQTATASKAISIKVVLGANHEPIQQQVDFPNTEVVLNKNWKKGLGTSIAAGISAIIQSKEDIDSVLVMLADQPLVDTAHLNKLLLFSEENKTKIIASDYGKNPGVPAIFPKNFFKELLQLEGDRGAKELMQKNKKEILSISAKHKLIDIDTPEEYQEFLKDLNK